MQRCARHALVACAVGFLVAVAPAAAAGQRGVRLEVTLPPASQRGTQPPVVQSFSVLADSRVRDLMHSGFPARLHYRLELWSRRGWFDDLKTRVEWDVIVQYSSLEREYVVIRLEGDRAIPLGTFANLSAAEDAIARPYAPPMRLPARRDRYYYNLTLDIEAISVSDLDELERWLRGELRPAVRGKKSAGTAVSRGIQTLMIKLLGGEQRHYETRSATFRP
ncbi:MAG: DUF4390 domain-containing protein [Gemmatimonadaceae bacterium]